MKKAVGPESILAWLECQDPAGESGVDGFDVRLGEDSTWVLHAMYEIVNESDSASVPRLVLSSGFIPQVERGIKRKRWRDRVQLRSRESGPVGTEGELHLTLEEIRDLGDGEIAPPRGTLDSESFDALIEVVSGWMNDGREAGLQCFYAAAKGFLHSGFESLRPHERHELFLAGSLGDFADMLRLPGGIDSTPTHVWPDSKSWFLWTPHESVATRISGPRGLIDAIRQNPHLECFDEPSKLASGGMR